MGEVSLKDLFDGIVDIDGSSNLSEGNKKFVVCAD